MLCQKGPDGVQEPIPREPQWQLMWFGYLLSPGHPESERVYKATIKEKWWVSVEELDWSAESQVLIPAEHFWCDFKCRPWAKNSYGYYIWVQSFHTLQICSNRGGNTIFKNMNYVPIFVATVWKCPFSLLKNILYRLIFFFIIVYQNHDKCYLHCYIDI